MNKISIGIIAFIIGLVLGIGGTSLSKSNSVSHRMPDGNMMHGVNHDMNPKGMKDSMDGMMAGLEGKTGDEFDRAFLKEMIMHHQGAVQMAEAALQNAQHQEIKDLANAIISAQNKEIADMQKWMGEWYK